MMHSTISTLHLRRESYDLLARLYLDEPSAGLVAALRGLPPFAEHVAPESMADAWLADLAVEYQRLFGMNVYAYESIFVDQELMLNTRATERTARLYHDCGFDSLGARVGAPDYLGLELRLMRDLIAAELHAQASGDAGGVRWARAQQALCLHDHLAGWAPICAHTITRVTTQPLYTLLATLTTELVLSDLDAVPAPVLLPRIALERHLTCCETRPPSDDSDLKPESPISLRPDGSANTEDPRGINTVVRQLITPATTGVLLTRADISGLGRVLQLPVTIGERFQMLRSLFDAAGQFDHLPALLDSLGRLFAEEDKTVAALMAACPTWSGYGQDWRQRIATGQSLIGELGAQAREFYQGTMERSQSTRERANGTGWQNAG
jgi:TorA maturation chaperone TorD